MAPGKTVRVEEQCQETWPERRTGHLDNAPQGVAIVASNAEKCFDVLWRNAH